MQLENFKEKKTEEFKEVEAPKTEAATPLDQINKYLERPNEKEIVAFLRELAILVEARVPLVRALNVIALHNKSKGVADMAKVMGRKIEDGGSLSEAMEEFRVNFSDLYIYVVKAGGNQWIHANKSDAVDTLTEIIQGDENLNPEETQILEVDTSEEKWSMVTVPWSEVAFGLIRKVK